MFLGANWGSFWETLNAKAVPPPIPGPPQIDGDVRQSFGQWVVGKFDSESLGRETRKPLNARSLRPNRIIGLVSTTRSGTPGETDIFLRHYCLFALSAELGLGMYVMSRKGFAFAKRFCCVYYIYAILSRGPRRQPCRPPLSSGDHVTGMRTASLDSSVALPKA